MPVSGLLGDASLFFRIALSCLADGDHSDTAIHYQDQTVNEPNVALRPANRLAALDRYVESLKNRIMIVRVCVQKSIRLAAMPTVRANIVSCDSPVGTGKTTAVMAHLLAQAQKRNLRRIIVVFPFTNIITQSVKVYRESACPPRRKPGAGCRGTAPSCGFSGYTEPPVYSALESADNCNHSGNFLRNIGFKYPCHIAAASQPAGKRCFY